MKRFFGGFVCLTVLLSVGLAQGADIVPDVIMMPGTQPNEATIEDPGRCLNCHKNYETNPRVEPGFGWMGAAMGNAGRDPIFWATLAIAEQDFDGAGDLCIRCHSAGGWIGGRSTPTDGSGLAASDQNGIDCDTCHQMTDPDMQVVDPISGVSIIGTMTHPFINNSGDSLDPALAGEGYYGSGMYALSNDYGKLGPYNEGDAVARHQFTGSDFHRDVDFCGTCHDVSNSAVGQLAPNSGAMPGSPTVIKSGEVGYPLNPALTPNDPAVLDGMAAFNNPAYAYGIVERTFSEYKASPLSSTLMDDFVTLPADLQDPRGSLFAAYTNSYRPADGTANYVDGDPRYISCQSCHMRAITGRGCDKRDAPNREDQPMHDQTGGNYWVYPLVQWQDQEGTLRLGGGLSAEQIEAMDDGILRAQTHLTQAVTLDVGGNQGNTIKITNMTGHKVITGYPEGRRMWLNIKFYDANGGLIEEVGEWGALPTTAINPRDGVEFTPWSIVDIDNPKLKVYEVHPAMTQEWAALLISVGYPTDMPLSFDRLTGQVDFTLGDLAALPNPGDYHETFHFALNNYVAFDNRIPPYRMDYDEALRRNALPVPADQYGGSPGGVYNHWDEFDISQLAPSNAAYADLTLYYQGTSWEYVQFLNNAVDTTNDGSGAPTPVTPFLAEEGQNFLDAWVNTGMVPPFAMATATWNGAGCVPEPEICDDGIDNDCDGLIDCTDSDCDGTPQCPNLIEWPMCFDGLDNDFDNLTDCADTADCQGESQASTCGIGECAATGIMSCLSNGTMDDTCTPGIPTTETCADGVDNDCDGFTDCGDTDCDTDPACQMQCSDYQVKGDCNNDLSCEWVGSPKNGFCQDATVCVPTPGEETMEMSCGDGIDNDCDGLVDCADADCDGTPDCPVMDCSVYNNRTDCRNAMCRWDNKAGVCVP